MRDERGARPTRRRLLAGAAVLGGSGAVAACSVRQEGASGAARKEPARLTLTSDWTNDAGGVRAQTLQHWATEFPKTNPNVREVEVIAIPSEGTSAGTFNIKVQTMFAAGSGPDVSMHIWPVDPAGILLPLDPYLKQKKFNKADYWWSKYYQEAADGRTFSLPLNAAAWGMIANVDLFEQAGVKLPTRDWTYADLRDLARRLKTGRTWGFDRTTGVWEMFSQFASEGAEWYDRQTRKTTLHVGKDGGKPQEMFEDWWGLVWRDRLAPNPDETREVRANAGLSGGALFATGLIGIASQAFHQISAPVTQIAGRFRYQVLWPPKSNHSGRLGYHTEVNAIVSNKASAAPDEAFELHYYWLSDEMQRFVAVNQPVMPPGRKWHRSKEVVGSAPGMEIWGDVADEAQRIGNDRHKWQGGTGASPKSLEWLDAVRAPLLDAALTKGGDPRVALREAVAAGDRALA